jgi:hypothetical protein
MAFAAGAMLFVITDDIIPETQSKGKARSATFAVMVGFVIMMMLDNMLGGASQPVGGAPVPPPPPATSLGVWQ